ncbi:insulinase family protein [candidate division WOR-3 bacterium]|nr:insulinase family protein [candidate division WOR-3 bacterium]
MPVKNFHFCQEQELKCEKAVLNAGLTVCWEPLKHIRSCSLAVAVNTGARDEVSDSWGYSHFIEHMLFKGTAKRKAYTIASTLEKKGGYLNAMTGYENTWIEAKCIDYQLPEVIELVGDMLSNSLFGKKSIEDEKEVIRQEIKSNLDCPEEIVFDHFFKDIFARHPLGRSVLGNFKSIKNVTRKKILDHFTFNYTNENTYVGVVGNICLDLPIIINKNFKLERRTPPSRVPFKMAYSGEKTYCKSGTKQINLVLGGIAPDASSLDRYKFQILMNLLGGGLSSRFFQLLREVNPLVYNVSSFYYPYSDVGVGGLYLSVTPDNLNKVEKLLNEEIKKILEGDISRSEVEFSKEQLKGNIILGLESSRARVNKLLNDQIYRGKWISLDDIDTAISSINLDDINKEAQKFFSDNNIMRTYLTPKAR